MWKPFRTLGDLFQSLLIWLSHSLKQTAASYCELQTADSPTVLVANDGSLVSVLRLSGVTQLIGKDEFERIEQGLQQALHVMSQPGHTLQVYFTYNKDEAQNSIREILLPGEETAKRLHLNLKDLFKERINYLSQFCAAEELYIVIWTQLKSLTGEQLKRARRDKQRFINKNKIPSFFYSQNLIAAIPDLRESHDSFVRSVLNDLQNFGIVANLLEVHEAVYVIRKNADPLFTDRQWRPSLPGDKITMQAPRKEEIDVADILWPPLGRQIFPRDGENLDLRTARVGETIYSTVFIHLFPKEVQTFARLFSRISQTHMPWRISFLIDSDGLTGTAVRKVLSSVLSITSAQNRLIHDSLVLLNYINLHSDDAVVKLRVAATTWAPEGDIRLLRSRTSMLAKALEGWGSCDVSEMSGDAYQAAVSTLAGVSRFSVATPSIAPLSAVLRMLPFFRPASPWENGAVLFRSPDGKPWPYHPGSHHQTTWIDLFYARPGSGKSVLSNAINLAACLSPGIARLPLISIIDVGPSSSGLIALLKDALPADQKHLVVYHRLRMRSEYAINPFDLQLGCRYPTPQERAFLVNFLSLLATPVGSEKSYDGVADMAGLVIDELYKSKSDTGNPNVYAAGILEDIDHTLEEIGFVQDDQTTWWEVTDALFMAGFSHAASLAQRYASPVLGDVTAICRLPVIHDLYGKIITPTGEVLIQAFARMISSAVREYPIIAQVTRFDLGEARVVALDLDEVARSGGDAANRQTAVMYMLARYVLARHYFNSENNIADMPEAYKRHHQTRFLQIQEDIKRIVFDEFHRTAKIQAVRDQVLQDMREGRKWKVQVALLSQSLDDFDAAMIEFATSIFIMDAGPEQSVQKTASVFGLTPSAALALKTRVHGPRAEGATFLAQFATKYGLNTQLLTLTLGPIELWALTTTAEDVFLRNQLYRKIGPVAARRVLATLFPSGTAVKELEERYLEYKDAGHLLGDEVRQNVLQDLLQYILKYYYSASSDPTVAVPRK